MGDAGAAGNLSAASVGVETRIVVDTVFWLGAGADQPHRHQAQRRERRDEQGKQRLAQGFCVVVFPEGTRIPFGQRGKYKIGGAMLAASSGVPVIPVAHNAGRLWGRNAFSKHPGLITMSIGTPIETKGLKADEINQRAETWIENEIQNLDH
jgi:1-acyl-sn-glycerol-3-phosphate acyltransferase